MHALEFNGNHDLNVIRGFHVVATRGRSVCDAELACHFPKNETLNQHVHNLVPVGAKQHEHSGFVEMLGGY